MNNPKVLCVLYKDLIFSDCLYSLFVLTLNGSIGLRTIVASLGYVLVKLLDGMTTIETCGNKMAVEEWDITSVAAKAMMQKCGDMLEVGQNHRVAATRVRQIKLPSCSKPQTLSTLSGLAQNVQLPSTCSGLASSGHAHNDMTMT